MDQLSPNPDGCKNFESNPFKKEKCKHCGHPWQLHAGVIDAKVVAQFTAAQQQVVDKKSKAEAEAKAKAKAAKAKARQRQNSTAAVEDAWFFDGGDAAAQEDSDDEAGGFKMFTGAQLAAAPLEKPQLSKANTQPLKVVNLIDFAEFAEDPDEPAPSAPQAPAVQRGRSQSLAAPPISPAMPQAPESPYRGPAATPTPSPQFPGMDLDAFTAEIEHLRQMLADANEEKNIQVAIVQDEVAEKTQKIAELRQEKTEAEASLKKALAQLEARTTEQIGDANQDGGAISNAEATVARQQEEIAELRKGVEEEARVAAESQELRAELARLREQAPAGLSPAASALLEELGSLSLRTRKALGGAAADRQAAAQAPGEQVGGLEAELQRLRDEATVTLTAAEKAAEERAASASGTAPEQPRLDKPPSSRNLNEEQRRHAALALRDVRRTAEAQLAWITARIHQRNPGVVAPSGEPPGRALPPEPPRVGA